MNNKITDKDMIFFYGPPGTGKSLLGKLFARKLNLKFIDLDNLIEERTSQSILEIFEGKGEEEFRNIECQLLDDVLTNRAVVVALGGGALLNSESRAKVEKSGKVICLRASEDVLKKRLAQSNAIRPMLLNGLDEKLRKTLMDRKEHYDSFKLQLDTSWKKPHQLVFEAQMILGVFYLVGMKKPYDVTVARGNLQNIGHVLSRDGSTSPVVVVSDHNVAKLYMQSVMDAIRHEGFTVESFIFPAGELQKTIYTLINMWNTFSQIGVERKSVIVALGGGVVGDLAGFGAAAYLRGLDWINMPTSLLAMVDSSIGGKTGADLQDGKNLIGAFHPPKSVLVDTLALKTLPEIEIRNGMAEVIKHGVIGDPELFEICSYGWESVKDNIGTVINRAIAVKVQIIEDDPYEIGKRAVLNLGHTLGHAIEKSSSYSVRHGEAVSIGMVASARLSEQLGIADAGLANIIASTLQKFGLPTEMPVGISKSVLLQAMKRDKKRAEGKVALVLPIRIGKVSYGITIENLNQLVDAV
jgi:3-dehydroquinate synthase